MKAVTEICKNCGHELSAHPPDPNRLFAWPCRACDCDEYKSPNSPAEEDK